jgi:hypothetical protein
MRLGLLPDLTKQTNKQTKESPSSRRVYTFLKKCRLLIVRKDWLSIIEQMTKMNGYRPQ